MQTALEQPVTPEPAELERCRFRCDGARIELTDGAVLIADVREYDPRYPALVELSELHRLGESVSTYDAAEAWLDAHEAEVVEQWAAHCLAER